MTGSFAAGFAAAGAGLAPGVVEGFRAGAPCCDVDPEAEGDGDGAPGGRATAGAVGFGEGVAAAGDAAGRGGCAMPVACVELGAGDCRWPGVALGTVFWPPGCTADGGGAGLIDCGPGDACCCGLDDGRGEFWAGATLLPAGRFCCVVVLGDRAMGIGDGGGGIEPFAGPYCMMGRVGGCCCIWGCCCCNCCGCWGRCC